MSQTALSRAAAGELPELDCLTARVPIVVAVCCAGVFGVFVGLYGDMRQASLQPGTVPLILLGLALAVAFGFELANGFHDTANAAATAIYTRSLSPGVAVVWSGVWNFLGVVLSSGVIAFSIVALLPVELILQAGQGAGLAMVFALLISATAWNLATWYAGLPVSSSHALIGAILGVGVVHHLLYGGSGPAGVDLTQVKTVGWSLLISPLIGFSCAAVLLTTARMLIRNPTLYRAPEGKPPPLWIRSVLILTCSGVSFGHGSNDGQKGMGLIMLILIGILPSAYAIDRSVDKEFVAQFAADVLMLEERIGYSSAGPPEASVARQELANYAASRRVSDQTLQSLTAVTVNLARQFTGYGELSQIPAEAVSGMRNDMYLVARAISMIAESGSSRIKPDAVAIMERIKLQIDRATQFIPLWVKFGVAVALGFGTTFGWKRVVVTVGERIGSTHLTYAQGGSAEIVAMATIFGADLGGLPVSTTHVLSSGIAGAMVASGSRLQWATVRNLAMAWLLTLPASMVLSGGLYFMFGKTF